MRNLIFDLFRVLLLLWKLSKFFLPYLPLYMLGTERSGRSFGVRLRLFAEEMGATYIKLGQYLAIRYDILSEDTCNELSKLMDDVPPIHVDLIRKRVAEELGGPLSDFFQYFDPKPIGAASIAQVHRAIARDGMLLAIKVQRPGVQRAFRSDLRNLRRLGRLVTWLRLFGDVSVVEVVDELTEFTLRETNFLYEAETAARIGSQSPPYVDVPKIRWDLTTDTVLSMEFIEGISLLDVCKEAERGDPEAFARLLPDVNAERLVKQLAWACLTQAYVSGRFHGDPHPANILIRPSGRIAFIDFGIFGELSPRQRELLARYAGHLALGRLQAAFRCYEELVIYEPETRVEEFRKETISVLSKWHAASTSRRSGIADKLGARYQVEMLGVLRRHHVRMQPDQVLFWRAQAVLDATAHRLPVEFDMLKTVADFFRSRNPPLAVLADHLQPEKINSQLAGSLKFFQEAPQNLEQLLTELVEERFILDIKTWRHVNDEHLANQRVKVLSMLVISIGLIRLWISWQDQLAGYGLLVALIFPVGLLLLVARMVILLRRLS